MAGLPLRLNKARIIIKNLQRSNTVRDPHFREPIGQKSFSDDIEVYGQIRFFSSKYVYKELDRTITGDREKVAGRITFKRTDLVKQGVSINKGDKIVSVGRVGQEIMINGRVIAVNPYAFRKGINLLVSVEFTHDYDTKESIKKGK